MSCLETFAGIEPRLVAAPAGREQPARGRAGPADWLAALTIRGPSPFAAGPLDGAARTLPGSAPPPCDAAVWLADSGSAPATLDGFTRHGAFTVRFGDSVQAIPLWDEVTAGRATVTTAIDWHETSLAAGRCVHVAETATAHGLDVTASQTDPVVAAIRLLAEALLELRSDPGRWKARARRAAEQPAGPSRSPQRPAAGRAVRFIASKLARSARLRATTRGREPHWFVALRRNAGASIVDSAQASFADFREVPLPDGLAQMADPFPFDHAGTSYLLFESVGVGSAQGRLAIATISSTGQLSDVRQLLERDYHMSYPCVIESGGEIFLLPESSAAKRVDLFRFSPFPSTLELVATPIDDVALVDTTPVLVDGIWYFFTTTTVPFMETVLFWSRTIDGPWELHPASPVSCTVRNSRGAGKLFWRQGRLFRPTQDCSERYGFAINVNEVTRLTPTEFEERPVSYAAPGWSPRLLGTHTWNESATWQAVDGLRLARVG